MSAPLPINYGDPHLYEHLSLIIDEFEKAALRSSNRQGIAATAQSPLGAMDMMLASSDKALNMGRTASAGRVSKRAKSAEGSSDTGGASTSSEEKEPWTTANNELDFQAESGNNADEDEVLPEPSFEVSSGGSFNFDADFNELFGGEGDPDKKGDTFGSYLEDCLGCDLRISFDWQLQPIDLLGPLAGLLADINATLDQFEGFLDENRLMASLCDLLNGLNFLCIPDLISILMALKMLLKSYLTFQLSIKLDWTMLLGPLLKLILDAIVTLLQQVAGIIVAPLDCAVAALMTVAELQNQLASTAALAGAVGARVADRTQGVVQDAKAGQDVLSGLESNTTTAGTRITDVEGANNFVDAKSDAFDVTIPAISTSQTSNPLLGGAGSGGGSSESTAQVDGGAGAEAGFSFPAAFELDSDTTLPQALQIPEFLQSNPFTQMALSVKEARDYIMNLVRKLVLSLRSLEGLVSGGLSVNLGNLGLLLFVRDMIRVVLAIITLFSQYGGNVKDWCEFLRNNPEALEAIDRGSTAEATEKSIVLRKGPRVVAEIKTCFNDRTDAQSALMQKWILDLKRDGSS